MKKVKNFTKEKLKLFMPLQHDKNLVIQYFKDDATAFNNQKNNYRR